jgi:hypothetical protein
MDSYEKQIFNKNFFDISVQNKDEIIEIMIELERKYLTGKPDWDVKEKQKAAFGLLPLLESKEWEIRAKALITIGRIGTEEIADYIIARLKNYEEPWWQLQALDCWWQLPVDDNKRAQILVDLTKWVYQPVTVRGLVWLLQALNTDKAVEIFIDFVLNNKTMVVKDEFLSAAWFSLAENKSLDFIDKLVSRNPKFKIWLNFHYPEENKSHYSLYPSPDYLWQCAAEFGVDRKSFKRLYFKPRKKS